MPEFERSTPRKGATGSRRIQRRTPPSEAREGADRPRSGAATRQRILDEAVHVIAEKGLSETRISDIARRAGIAYGLVYHYFKNKEEIVDTIFDERWGQFIQALQSISERDEPVVDKLHAVTSVILASHRTHPEWVKVLLFEIQRTQRLVTPERRERVAELYHLIARMLREGQSRGELRSDLDPNLACFVFLGGLDSVMTFTALGVIGIDEDRDASERAYHARLAQSVVELFMHGAGVPSSSDGE